VAIAMPKMEQEMKKKRLPPHIEKTVVNALVDPMQKSLPFMTICNQRPDVFGTPASKERERAQNRQDYL
jgi:hypothetical protein